MLGEALGSIKMFGSRFVFSCLLGLTLLSASLTTSEFCGLERKCGWLVYVPYTKVKDYVVRTPCVCEPSQRCTRRFESISISSYVYKCIWDWQTTDDSLVLDNE